MCDQPASLLVADPIDRYLLNSTMQTQFKMDDDGGLTLCVRNESAGKDKEANWLPSPNGHFWVVLRLYVPKPEAFQRAMETATVEAGKSAIAEQQ